MSDQGWIIVGWTLLAFAVLMAFWGAMRIIRLRRRRTLRRCPRCWYDMSHTDGRTCNECGRSVRRERYLYRCRRRRLPFVAALLIMAAGFAARGVPEVRAHGWARIVPTPVIIALLPHLEPCYYDGFLQFLGPKDSTSQAARAMLLELEERVDEHNLADWEWQYLISRILGDAERLPARTRETGHFQSYYSTLLDFAETAGQLSMEQLARADASTTLYVDMARTWPDGATLFAAVYPDYWRRGDIRYTIHDRSTGGLIHESVEIDRRGSFVSWAYYPWRDHLTPLQTVTRAMTALRYRVKIDVREAENTWRHLRTYDLDLPITVVDSVETIVTAIPCPEVDLALASASCGPTFGQRMVGERMILLTYDFSAAALAMAAAGIEQLAVCLELLDEAGNPWARTHAWWPRTGGINPIDDQKREPMGSKPNVLVFDVLGEPLTEEPTGPITLRITGDPITALRNREQTSCWAGTVDVELKAP